MVEGILQNIGIISTGSVGYCPFLPHLVPDFPKTWLSAVAAMRKSTEIQKVFGFPWAVHLLP